MLVFGDVRFVEVSEDRFSVCSGYVRFSLTDKVLKYWRRLKGNWPRLDWTCSQDWAQHWLRHAQAWLMQNKIAYSTLPCQD